MRRIYLDHNATTPVAPEVVEAMLPFLRETYGNPSSLHWFGQQARAALDGARAEVAALVGGQPAEVVFTSGGTEADNAALHGVATAAREGRRQVLYSAIEHHAVTNAARALARSGVPVEAVRARADGQVDLEDLEARLGEATVLVALMAANNETGVLQPVAEAVRLAHARGALVLCDAVQAAGKTALDVAALGVDLLALSAHKLGGPKGVGALWVRRGTRLEAWVRGGSQERSRRAGTENVAGIVGMGRAAVLARSRLGTEPLRLAALRDDLERRLLLLPGAAVNGTAPRIPNTLNVSFAGVEAESLLLALDLAGVAVSTGAACAAGTVEPSHVLRAMGLPPERVQSSVRFSLGHGNTAEEVVAAAAAVAEAVARQRRRGHS